MNPNPNPNQATRSLYNGITDAKRARARLGIRALTHTHTHTHTHTLIQTHTLTLTPTRLGTAGAPDAGAGLLRRQDELIARLALESSDIQAQIAALQTRVGARGAKTPPSPAAEGGVDAAGAEGAADAAGAEGAAGAAGAEGAAEGGEGGEEGAKMPEEAAAADGDDT